MTVVKNLKLAFGIASELKSLFGGGGGLSEISGKVDELLVASQKILEGIEANRKLQIDVVLAEVKSLGLDSLDSLNAFQASGKETDRLAAASSSMQALSKIVSFASTASVERTAIAPIAILAAEVRMKVLNELGMGAMSADWKVGISAAADALTGYRADLLDEFSKEFFVTVESATWVSGGSIFLPDVYDYTFSFRTVSEPAYKFWETVTVRTEEHFAFFTGQVMLAQTFLTWFDAGDPFGGVTTGIADNADDINEIIDIVIANELSRGIGQTLGQTTDQLKLESGGQWLKGADGTVNDVLASNQNFTYKFSDVLDGYAGNDTLIGGWGNDTLRGDSGKDKLFGNLGNDILLGGTGKDVLDGGVGNDLLDGGAGEDMAGYSQSSSGVTVSLDLSKAQEIRVGSKHTLRDIENLKGSDFDDVLAGDAGKNKIYGLDGVDRISGASGSDLLNGGSGNDKIYGQNGNDKVNGGNGADKLFGGAGNDKLFGQDGKDKLQGDTGKDILTGGKGADIFVFRKTSDSTTKTSTADVITDFQKGVDRVDLHLMDASIKLVGNNAFTFDGTKAFGTSKQGDIYFEKFNNAGKKNDYTMVYIDTDADKGAEMKIKFFGLINFAADDFIL